MTYFPRYDCYVKKILCFSAVTLVILSGIVPANAAGKATVVTIAFKNLLNANSDNLDALEQKYESDIDNLDAALTSATKLADENYNQELLAATNLYAPQIATATKKQEVAKSTYESNNKVRLTTGFFGENDRLNWALDCLPVRQTDNFKMLKRYCAGVAGIPVFPESGYGYEDWQLGDITTIALINAENKYVAIGIEKGYIVPLNLTAFDSSRIGYKQALTEIESLTNLNGRARAAAKTKRDNAVAAATSARESALNDLTEQFESAKAELEARETAANLALLAAKRASKDANFDSAFVIAYKFEYNRQKVGEIADAAWTGEWTFRTIDSIIKVNKLAALGDLIANKYSKNQAVAFNSAVGNAFTNEPDFRAALKVLTGTYKNATKTSLKF